MDNEEKKESTPKYPLIYIAVGLAVAIAGAMKDLFSALVGVSLLLILVGISSLLEKFDNATNVDKK